MSSRRTGKNTEFPEKKNASEKEFLTLPIYRMIQAETGAVQTYVFWKHEIIRYVQIFLKNFFHTFFCSLRRKTEIKSRHSAVAWNGSSSLLVRNHCTVLS